VAVPAKDICARQRFSSQYIKVRVNNAERPDEIGFIEYRDCADHIVSAKRGNQHVRGNESPVKSAIIGAFNY
jgi:hypothetical protein